MPGRLILLPVPLAADPHDASQLDALLPTLSPIVISAAARLRHFSVENARSARAFLKAVAPQRPVSELTIVELVGPRSADIETHLAPLLSGADVGLMSEAGCPGIADPGAELVTAAHQRGISVDPLPGPSAVLLALMASGCSGQRFAFHGYLPIELTELAKRLRRLEEESAAQQQTQLWIETAYRVERTLRVAIDTLAGDSRLTLAADLTLPGQSIRSASITQWRGADAAVGKRLAVFVLQARPRLPPGRARAD